MTHYVAVQIVPKDMEVLNRYFAVGRAALEKHGGKVVAGGPDSKVLEDNGAGDPVKVLAQFPDAASAEAWINDPELADVHAMRREGAHTTITLLPPLE
jgi:uncharacterized protein (DUF1330 family)